MAKLIDTKIEPEQLYAISGKVLKEWVRVTNTFNSLKCYPPDRLQLKRGEGQSVLAYKTTQQLVSEDISKRPFRVTNISGNEFIVAPSFSNGYGTYTADSNEILPLNKPTEITWNGKNPANHIFILPPNTRWRFILVFDFPFPNVVDENDTYLTTPLGIIIPAYTPTYNTTLKIAANCLGKRHEGTDYITEIVNTTLSKGQRDYVPVADCEFTSDGWKITQYLEGSFFWSTIYPNEANGPQ